MIPKKVYWKAYRSCGIDFIGEITDLDGLEIVKSDISEMHRLTPSGLVKSFIWNYYPPGQDVPILVQRDIFLWGNDVNNLCEYVEKNYSVIQWANFSTQINRFPTAYEQHPTLKILRNDRKKQDFPDLLTFTQHNKGWDFDFKI